MVPQLITQDNFNRQPVCVSVSHPSSKFLDHCDVCVTGDGYRLRSQAVFLLHTFPNFSPSPSSSPSPGFTQSGKSLHRLLSHSLMDIHQSIKSITFANRPDLLHFLRLTPSIPLSLSTLTTYTRLPRLNGPSPPEVLVPIGSRHWLVSSRKWSQSSRVFLVN